jgi:hypothetical protein
VDEPAGSVGPRCPERGCHHSVSELVRVGTGVEDCTADESFAQAARSQKRCLASLVPIAPQHRYPGGAIIALNARPLMGAASNRLVPSATVRSSDRTAAVVTSLTRAPALRAETFRSGCDNWNRPQKAGRGRLGRVMAG